MVLLIGLLLLLGGCGPAVVPTAVPPTPVPPTATPDAGATATAAARAQATRTAVQAQATQVQATAAAIVRGQTRAAATETARAAATAQAAATATAQQALQLPQVALLGRGRLTGARWSPDGRLIAVSTTTGVAVYDAGTQELVRAMDVRSLVLAELNAGLYFSPDGRFLALSNGEAPSAVHVWEVANGRRRWTLAGYRVAFSPGADLLAVSDYTAGVSVWQLAGQERLWQTTGDEIAFAPAGSQLAVYNDRTVQIWDLETRQLRQSFPGDYGPPEMAFSPDGALFAVGWCVEGGMWCDLSRVFLYDVASGQQAGVWEVPAGINQVLFSPDGGLVAMAADDGSIRLWDVPAGRELTALTAWWERGHVEDLAFDPAGDLLVATDEDDRLRLWTVPPAALRSGDTGQVRTAGQIEGFGGSADSVAFSPDGRWLAFSGDWTGAVQLWEVATGQRVAILRGHTSDVHAVAFSPDGAHLATVSGGYQGEMEIVPAEVRLWDVTSGQLVHEFVLPDLEAFEVYLGVSADGLFLAARESGVRVWDALAGRELGPLNNQGWAYDVAFSPGGTRLAVLSESGVQVWELAALQAGPAAGQVLSGLEGTNRWARAVAFTADDAALGVEVCTGYARRTCTVRQVQVWKLGDVPALQETWPAWPAGEAGGGAYRWAGEETERIAVSPDGTLLLLYYDGIVHLWETATQRLVGLAPAGAVNSVAFSPAGRLLATGLEDGTVALWAIP